MSSVIVTRDPAILVYTSDLIRMMADLTFEEKGQFMTLLLLQHQHGEVSDKVIKLQVPNVSPDVLAKFEKGEEGYWCLEWASWIQKRRDYAESRRKNSVKRKKNENNYDTPYDIEIISTTKTHDDTYNNTCDDETINTTKSYDNSHEDTYTKHTVKVNVKEKENKIEEEKIVSNDIFELIQIRFEKNDSGLTLVGPDYSKFQILLKNIIGAQEVDEVFILQQFAAKIAANNEEYNRKQIWPRLQGFLGWFKQNHKADKNENKRDKLLKSL